MLQIKVVVINKNLKDVYDTVIELFNSGYIVYTISNNTLYKFKNGIKACSITSINDVDSNIKTSLLDLYFKCIAESGCSVSECIIVDDNFEDLKIARMTGCNICLEDMKSINALSIIKSIIYYQDENRGILKPTMFQKRINIVIPMMGVGLRLHSNTEKGYVDIMDKPMISWVIQNLKIDANYVFIINNTSDIDKLLLSLVPGCKIVRCKHKTEGQIGSIIMAEKYINNDAPLIVANDNQWLDWDIETMIFDFLLGNADNLLQIVTFISDGNHKYNYLKLDDDNNVVFIKQNIPITELAMTDVYFWRRGQDFIRCAHKMTSMNKRIRGEFCTMMVVNELFDEINDDKITGKITASQAKYFTTLQDMNEIDQFKNYWISNVKCGFDL